MQSREPAIVRRRALIAEVAAELRVSDETIRRRIRQGLPHDRVGRQIRLNLEEVREWLAGRK